MADETKDYGRMNKNFNELVKKYKPVDENEAVIYTPAKPEPEIQPEPEEPKPAEPMPEEIKPEKTKSAESKSEEPKPKDAQKKEKPLASAASPFAFDDGMFEDEDEFNMTAGMNPSYQLAIQSDDDDSPTETQHDEPEKQEKSTHEERPKLAYDLNMFGGSVESDTSFEDIDDSWLDESLDDSIFEKPVVADEPVAEKKSVVSAQDETADAFEPEIELPPEIVGHAPEMVPVAGGYIAPRAVDNFSFDEDSGLDFDEDYDDVPEEKAEAVKVPQVIEKIELVKEPDADEEPEPEEEPEAEEEIEKSDDFEKADGFEEISKEFPEPATGDEDFSMFEEKPVHEKKAKKRRAETGKNEVTSMTEFEKEYKNDGRKKKKGNFFKRNIIPQRGDSAFEVFRKIIMTIAILAIIGSGGYLFNDYVIVPYRTEKEIGELSDMIGNGSAVADTGTLASKYPGVKFPEGMLEKYAALYARNQDFVGWITIDGLDISLPVVRGENNDKYLKIDFDGKSNKYGSLFMNCINTVDSLDMNTTIFGHYMKDTKMFGNLMQYKSVSGYKKAPVIEFNTIYGDYKWKIFAVFISNGKSVGDNGYLFNYIFSNLKTQEDMNGFLGEVKQRSIYYPMVDIALSDKILTLSTCTYEFSDARLVVMARMVRPGEDAKVDTSNVRFNPNPRYPQAYYDEKSLSNPYSSAAKWYPS